MLLLRRRLLEKAEDLADFRVFESGVELDVEFLDVARMSDLHLDLVGDLDQNAGKHLMVVEIGHLVVAERLSGGSEDVDPLLKRLSVYSHGPISVGDHLDKKVFDLIRHLKFFYSPGRTIL